MIRATASCHEGESAERALGLMKRTGLDIVPVTNDNDRVTGVVIAHELTQALRSRGASAPRMRDVMRRSGFVVCRASEEPAAVSARIEQTSSDCAVVLDANGYCVGVVDRRRPEARN